MRILPMPVPSKKSARPASGSHAKSSARDRPYHHGRLAEALLVAAERVLVRDGIGGLGLRAIAREAEVSHTAPRHHFGDTAGLLSALAAVGMQRLGDAMQTAQTGLRGERARSRAIAAAYVDFADAHPALFGLMFKSEKIDMLHPALAEAAAFAMHVMAGTLAGESAGTRPVLSRADALRITAAWAYVHGLANLLIDHRLTGILQVAPGFVDALDLAHEVLRSMRISLDPGIA